MDNKFSTIKGRCLELAETKGFSKESFCEKIGMTYGNFKGSAKKTPLNSNAIENILSIVPDVNLIWLITGKGDILKQQDDKNTEQKEIVVYRSDPRDIDMIELQREHIKILKEQLTLGSARLDFHSGAPSTESTPIPSITGPKRAKNQPKPH